MFSFGGKIALVIGGGQNIGREIVLEFARRGAHVAAADINDAGARETAEIAKGSGVKAIGLRCDIASDAAVAETIAAAEAALGPIDILVNNAGVILSGNPEDIPVPEWARVLDINLLGAVRAINALMPRMQARGSGYIVNTASFAGLYPYAANRLPYAASKAALVSLSENLAIYLEPQGVRVSCLCPGPIATTIADGMKTWSADVAMRGPGSHLAVIGPQAVAVTLADGMEQGRILIPSHEAVFDTLRERAADPDAFVRRWISDFAEGKLGLPGR